MTALPARRYEIGEWKLKVGVNIDYHVEYDHRFYSVPCALMNSRVDVRATATVIEIWQCGVRITSHERSHGPKSTAVTDPTHRPRAHREWGNWPPERLVGWAEKMGPKTAEVVAAILTRRTHPETGRRASLGLMRLAEKYSPERLESASGRAILLEVLEDRHDQRSTVATSQVPTKTWHEMLADPTVPDAICDRLVHNAHVLSLKGPSIRKKKGLGEKATEEKG